MLYLKENLVLLYASRSSQHGSGTSYQRLASFRNGSSPRKGVFRQFMVAFGRDHYHGYAIQSKAIFRYYNMGF